jgi:hypothetical protein
LSKAFDRSQRLAITHAYWALTGAVAEYGYCFEELAELNQFQVRPEESPLLRTAKASAEAALRAAEVALVAKQYDLAELLGSPSSDPLPLPADLPHVGPYRTQFDQVASRQALPPRTRLVDRMLPIRRKAIDVWASATLASEDALQAVLDAYSQSATDLATVLEYRTQLGRRQRALIGSVCDYNHDIADYAMTVAGPEITGQALVAMLIKSNRPSPSRSVPSGGSGGAKPLRGASDTGVTQDASVLPAMANELVPTEAQPDRSVSAAPQPTLAPPRELAQPPVNGQPTLAPPRNAVEVPVVEQPASASMPETREAPGTGQPTLAPPQKEETANEVQAPAKEVPASEGSLVPVNPEPNGPLPNRDPALPQPSNSEAAEGSETGSKGDQKRESADPSSGSQPTSGGAESGSQGPQVQIRNKPILHGQPAGPAAAGLYPGLVDAKPSVRAQRLAEGLYWNRSISELTGKTIELKDCLREVKPADRQELIAAYWLARQHAAEYQTLVTHNDWLEELSAFALERRRHPGGPEEMLRLRAAQLAVKANLLEMQLKLMDAQFELTRRAGLPLDSTWLLPTTAPHAGPYLLKLEAQSREVVASWPIKRLTVIIPGLTTSLQDRATAVVEADLARAAAAAAYQAGAQPIDYVLTVANRQTTETRAFLATVSEYNRAIATYVLTVLPASVSSDKLVQALVLK